ncbi:OOP family OmpA-OmpF porin [Luteibacter sp. HA06]|jgi:opacity protein-like surface antigen
MEKLLLTAAAAAALSFAAFGANASSEGTFVGINGGQTHYDISHSGFQDKKDAAFGAVAGYRWAVDRPFYLGVEAGYVDLGKISSKYEYGTPSYGETDKFKLKGRAVLVGANGKWELPHHWTITARLGLAHSHTSYDVDVSETYAGQNVFSEKYRDSSNDNGIYAGIGFGYDFTKNFGVTVNYDNYSLKAQGITDDKRTVNVGVWGGAAEFRF